MRNTRVSAANASARSIVFLIVLAFVLVTAVTLLFYQDTPYSAAVNDCSGYGGAPSHEFIQATGDAQRAHEHCKREIPTISISVKNRNYINLQRKRLEALDTGVLLTSGADFVPAHFTFKGKLSKGRVRLKGDWTTHLEKKVGWSLRVILSGDNEIWGRRRFSLQLPKVRNYDVEPLYSHQLQQAGLMPVQARLVRVEFNGEPWGLMSLEDHFTKELMEIYQRKESVISRFDESDMWQHQAANGDTGVYDNVYTSDFFPFNERKVGQSESLLHYARLASSMMAAWQEGRLPLGDILDVDAFRRFIAITEAWGGWHAFRWHNMRFYLNPYTLKLEPVPFDNGTPLVDISRFVAYLFPIPNSTAHSIISAPLNELYDDPDMLALLKSDLREVYDDLVVTERFDELAREQAFLRKHFQPDDIPITVDLDLLRRNYDYLLANFDDYFRPRDEAQPVPENPEHRQYSSMVKLNIYDNGQVSLANRMPFEVVVKDIRFVSRYGLRQPAASALQTPLTLPPTPLRQRARPVFVDLPGLQADDSLEVSVENPVTGQLLREKQKRRLLYLDRERLAATTPGAAPASTPPDWISTAARQWTIPAGDWRLDAPLVVPRGTVLDIEAGARLTMAPDSYILARGALNINGTADAEVIMQTEPGQYWGGIYVIDADQRSQWRHARISQLRPFTLPQFTLTGALNFYRSAISMHGVHIEGVAGEDAINTIESEFLFADLHLSDSSSDGFDSDYSVGRIESSQFSNIGGDAIDTSGSHVEVSSVTLESIRDKAVSAGEASTLQLQDLDINAVGVGVAVKDYSSVTVKDARIATTGLAAIMAYSKKPEYGGAIVSAEGIAFDDSSEVAICQLGSTLLLEGESVTPRKVNVDYLYGEGIMRK